MSAGLPTAIINGIEKFGAKGLAELLVKNDIKVVGVGEYPEGMEELKRFEYASNLEEVEEKADYIFDFRIEKKIQKRAEEDKAKLTIIGINQTIDKNLIAGEVETNWRIINLHGVYGPGIDDEENDQLTDKNEIGWFLRAIKLAVANKNLVLPTRESVLRLLAINDTGEAIMRASFLSGTEKEVFNIWGEKISSEEIAKVLMDEAKMTRFKVSAEPSLGLWEAGKYKENEIEEEWRRLRWKPTTDLREGMKETLQYYFFKADEESRNKKISNVKFPISKQTEDIKTKTIENKKRFEVEVEEEEKENDKFLISNVETEKKETNKEEVKKMVEEIIKEEYSETEEEELPEIMPIIVKNSNNRPVYREEERENDKFLISNVETENRKTEEKKINIRKKGNWGKYWRWGAVAMAAIIIGVIAGEGAANYTMFRRAGGLPKLIAEKKYEEADKLMQSTLKRIKSEEAKIEDWGWNSFGWGRKYQTILKVLEQGMVVGSDMTELAKHGEIISEGVFKDKEIDWKTELTDLKKYILAVDNELGVLQARLSGDWSWVPGRWKGNLADLKKQLAEARNMAGMGSRVVEVLPEVLGTDGKRREYMVLLQNENELRPGGGFIGSWAILSFEGGRLLNFEIKDIYEADGQLKGHVEPPEPIKNYLGEAGWFMRDANWQGDFTASSKDIQWFLEKETGRKVDGVIGVNLAVAKAILGVVGEVYVPDFKEKINKDNLYEQAEFYSETKFFPGSNQKASFLGGVGKQLFEEIKNMKADKRQELLKVVIEMLERNEIQVVLNNKAAATVMAELGWNGAMYEGKCLAERCFADYLYILEANLGVNKANYFLYRSVEETTDISDKSIGRVVKITYENTAKNRNWPGGDYKNYLRVYIPESSNIAEVSVTEGVKGGVKTVYTGDKLKVSNINGKKEIGMLLTVPIGSKRIVEIRYVDQIDLTKMDKFSYLNYIQKQSGFGDTGLVTLITIPNGWQPTQVEPMATLMGDKLLFNQKLERDIKMGVEIER